MDPPSPIQSRSERRREQNRLAQQRFRLKHGKAKTRRQYSEAESNPDVQTPGQEPGSSRETSHHYRSGSMGSVTGLHPPAETQPGAEVAMLDFVWDDLTPLRTPSFDFCMPSATLDPALDGGETSQRTSSSYRAAHTLPIPAAFTNGEDVLDPANGVEQRPSPLYVAVRNGNGKIVRLLLQHDADCNERDRDGSTPLIRAVVEGHDDVVDALLAHGADIHYTDNQQRSALHWAVAYRREYILKKLLKHAPDMSRTVNHVAKDGRTPLHMATELGLELIVEALLESGAKV